MNKYWVIHPDVKVSDTSNEHLYFNLINRGKGAIFEKTSSFMSFLNFLCECRSIDNLYEWGYNNDFDNKTIEETLHMLLETQIVLTGNKKWNYDGESRLWSYLSSQSNSLDKLSDSMEKLNSSRVGIIGVGGVGSRVAHELASMGIPSMLLIDPDKLSYHNLTHQTNFPANSVGEYKVNILKEVLNENYSTIVTPLPIRIHETLSQELVNELQKCSVVILCADEPSVDLLADWITPYLTKYNIPHIVGGGYHAHYTNTGTTIIPGITGCWRCLDVLLGKQANLPSSSITKEIIKGVSGSFNPLVSILSSLIVSDAMALITDLWKPLLINRMGDFDLYTGEIKWRTGKKLNSCTNCNYVIPKKVEIECQS